VTKSAARTQKRSVNAGFASSTPAPDNPSAPEAYVSDSSSYTEELDQPKPDSGDSEGV
jgi:hypothetical protein